MLIHRFMTCKDNCKDTLEVEMQNENKGEGDLEPALVEFATARIFMIKRTYISKTMRYAVDHVLKLPSN